MAPPPLRSTFPLPRLASFRTGAPKTTRVHVARGALGALGHLDAPLGLDPEARHVLVTDERVDRLHGQRLVALLRGRGLDVAYVVVPEGEGSKSLAQYVALVDRVLELGADERTTMISLGGGVVCNLTGMIAATLFRGVRLVHVPTTLMSQADAAIGHKQALNGPRGKNLVGSYYAPDLVWVDPDTLLTLEERWVRDGFAEILKHALAQDEALLACVSQPDATLRDLDFVTECIERTVALKCSTIDADPLERDEAMVLQYGHTVGHAVEHAAGYALGHGESVAIGMVAAARIAADLVGVDTVDAHRELLHRWALPTEIPRELDPSLLLDRIRRGKRCTGETLWMALVDGPARLARHGRGCAWPVPVDECARILGWYPTHRGSFAPCAVH
ncbi:MAG: iron-containing alcohol dehydrogenase [Deltaproteobacteria bacterium]|nr:iron-containing alcohol dehydrogenase [Deltaproteobacteria bacterium]